MMLDDSTDDVMAGNMREAISYWGATSAVVVIKIRVGEALRPPFEKLADEFCEMVDDLKRLTQELLDYSDEVTEQEMALRHLQAVADRSEIRRRSSWYHRHGWNPPHLVRRMMPYNKVRKQELEVIDAGT